ncbi:MAG: DUF4157 domain-containing protein, partial [Chloroflexi bacterium]|nr:DUF4157 domain-containing protein [Chloroflexota bacterium]
MVQTSHRLQPSVRSSVQRQEQSRSAQTTGRDSHALQRALADPARCSPADILSLQRTIGNRATQSVLAQIGAQGKLTVGPAHDRYEQEADRVASQVMRSQAASPATSDNKDEARRKPTISPLAQRAPATPEAAAADGSFEAGAAIENRLNSLAGGGQPLPEPTRAKMESGFGADFGAVRVHSGGEAARVSRSLKAEAFTRGSDIYFGAGRYDPGTGAGQHLLAHELTHVVQQTGGSAKAQRRFERNKIQRKVKVGEAVIGPEVLETLEGADKTGLVRLRNMIKTPKVTYRFATQEDMATYAKYPDRSNLFQVENEEPEAPRAPWTVPATAKKGPGAGAWARGITGGILGVLGSPLGAVGGAAVGAYRGARGAGKSFWNRFGRGNKSWWKKGLAGIGSFFAGLGGAIGGLIGGGLAGAAMLPAVGAYGLAPELAEGQEDPRAGKKQISTMEVKAGDIVLVHGGPGLESGVIQAGQVLSKIWSGKVRGGDSGFRHAGIALGGGEYAHSGGAGVLQDQLENGLFVYRCKDTALATQAAKIAKQWSVAREYGKKVQDQVKMKYSKGKVLDVLLHSSKSSKSRAAVLAAYFVKGVTPGAMFCSEFAVSCYQAAALLP